MKFRKIILNGSNSQTVKLGHIYVMARYSDLLKKWMYHYTGIVLWDDAKLINEEYTHYCEVTEPEGI